MALLPIIIAPDPRLKQISAPVERVDDEVRQLMDDMLETMYQAPGVGLAAPQVGVLRRIIVLDASKKDEERQPYSMVNPKLLRVSDQDIRSEEGCLSLPEHYADVVRPATIRVRYLDHEGEIRELDAEGLLATCIQHEMDHLEGILFVDHLSALKRNMILRKLIKAKKAGKPPAPAAAAKAMRRILVENARRKRRVRHGGERQRAELADPPAPELDEKLLALDDALSRLEIEDQVLPHRDLVLIEVEALDLHGLRARLGPFALVEALQPGYQLANDQHGPAVAKNFVRFRNWAILMM